MFPNTSLGSFGTPANTSTSSAGLTFGSGTSTMASSFNLTPAASTTTAATAFSMPNTTSVFNLGGNTGLGAQKQTTTAPSFGFNTFTTSTAAPLGGATTTTTASSFSWASTSTTGFKFPNKPTTQGFATPATTTTLSSTLTTPATTTTVASTTLPVTTAGVATNPATQINFTQLEENINKWTIELEEQEKVFMNQVAHINEWDRLLLSNGDKIVSLNNNVEKMKLEQQQLDHELDFIVAQQRELEECLLPLEKEFADVSISDPGRDATYRMAEVVNTQLRHMSEDLKEIIEDINEKNKNHDTSDPIVQIGRILNAHMNSLQWVDQNTALLKQQLDQVTKLTEAHRRENDSTQNL